MQKAIDLQRESNVQYMKELANTQWQIECYEGRADWDDRDEQHDWYNNGIPEEPPLGTQRRPSP